MSEVLRNSNTTTATADQVIRYYIESQSYLEGPLQGTCHFGFTEEGKPFRLYSALHAMEIQLGETLDLPPGSTVLDAGCGYGRVATMIAGPKFDLNVIGVDLVQQRIEEARRFTDAHGLSKKVELIRGNYSELPLDDSSVDGVYTMETLVHADPLESALGEFKRVLKPGGKLVLFEYSVPDRNSLDPIRKKITDDIVSRTGMASIGRFVHDGFQDILQEAGFENIVTRDISPNVWPTWGWLFRRALRKNGLSLLPKILQGKLTEDPNLAGSLLIWPYKSQLRYNIISANKPGSPA